MPLGLNLGNGPGDDDHWLVIIDNMVRAHSLLRCLGYE